MHIEEAARLLRLVQKDPESHVVGAFLNWRYVPTGAERAAWDIKELDLNVNRGKGKLPIKLPRPWHGEKSVPTPDMVPADSPDRTAALARLKSLS